ncbi:MAG: glucosamine-6-phosphate deaminase [Ruminococcaceae bacterium]|nr:glucosamine-6-phosphate deaminase [Oscillospiraceae bacterium]
MKIYVCPTYDVMSKKAADVMSAQLILKPDSVLGLATGSSPLGLYGELVERCERGEISFEKVTTVNLDEYCGLSPDNDQSYSYFMHKNLFDRVNIRPENVHLPDGTNTDAEAETKRYDALIASVGGVDMQLLGIGVDGHIGFNEPADHFSVGTVRVALTESTIEANSRFFASEDEVPRYAYSMGCGTILNADKILFIANGKNKAEILEQAFFGPVTPQVPASLLQLVADKVYAFVDAEAGALLAANHPEEVILV